MRKRVDELKWDTLQRIKIKKGNEENYDEISFTMRLHHRRAEEMKLW